MGVARLWAATRAKGERAGGSCVRWSAAGGAGVLWSGARGRERVRVSWWQADRETQWSPLAARDLRSGADQ